MKRKIMPIIVIIRKWRRKKDNDDDQIVTADDDSYHYEDQDDDNEKNDAHKVFLSIIRSRKNPWDSLLRNITDPPLGRAGLV